MRSSQRLREAPPTQLPLLDLNAPAAIAHWLLSQGQRFAYDWQFHGETLT